MISMPQIAPKTGIPTTQKAPATKQTSNWYGRVVSQLQPKQAFTNQFQARMNIPIAERAGDIITAYNLLTIAGPYNTNQVTMHLKNDTDYTNIQTIQTIANNTMLIISYFTNGTEIYETIKVEDFDKFTVNTPGA